jgi:predicted 3-demethylubiquinone-9 3-methyltransferase (glyoxalase superfamily)
MTKNNITPFLWYNNNAEEAVNFYISVFKKARVEKILRYGKGAPLPEGTALTIAFELNGLNLVALNGGPHYQFNPAVSFAIDCGNQEEIDYYWNKLTEGGKEEPCGWLRDRFGLSWQVVPEILAELLSDPDPARASYAMNQMMKMKKIVIKDLTKE